LERLYKISKALATFESVERSFPEILSLAAKAFPLLSAVLIEKRGAVPKTTIWPTTGLDEEHVKTTISRARSVYSYLTDLTPAQATDLSGANVTQAPLSGHEYAQRCPKSPDRFLVLPLILGSRRVFGVVQFEAQGKLGEGDLYFVEALADLIAVALDRCYRIMEERELQKSERENLMKSQGRVFRLEEEGKLRETFVNTLSHDLRLPLTSATLSAQLIARSPENASNSQLLASRIVSDLSRMERMISDLLDASRVRAGERLRLDDVRVCNLRSLTVDTIVMLRAIHGDRFVLGGEQVEVWGYWNSDGLRRVIENLATNAIKYGRPEGPVTVTVKLSGQCVELSVHNQGEPIPPQDRANLFQQFKRLGSAHNSKKKGWGLGLAVVRGVVEAHGGEVSIESSAGHGTTFVVTLPIDSRPQAVQAEVASAY
jgi:signal transduction histidine kinase